VIRYILNAFLKAAAYSLVKDQFTPGLGILTNESTEIALVESFCWLRPTRWWLQVDMDIREKCAEIFLTLSLLWVYNITLLCLSNITECRPTETGCSCLVQSRKLQYRLTVKAEAIFTASRKSSWLAIFYGKSRRKNSQSATFLRRRTNSKEGAESAIHSLPEINLNINFKAQNRKSKTDTNPYSWP